MEKCKEKKIYMQELENTGEQGKIQLKIMVQNYIKLKRYTRGQKMVANYNTWMRIRENRLKYLLRYKEACK